jgi:predicted Zn-dependent peptidase
VQNLPGRNTVAAGVWVAHGSAHDPGPLAGVTHLVEHLTLRRCGGENRRAIAALMDRLGGDVDAWTGAEMMGVSLTTTTDAMADGLGLLTDAILEPSFDPEDVELERKVILAELELIRDDPSELVEEALLDAAWGDHPLARPVIGSAASVSSISAEALIEHHRGLVLPGRLVVALSGDLNGVDPAPFLERLPLDGLPRPLGLPELRWLGEKRLITRRWADQVHTRIAFEAIPSGDSRLAALMVLNRLLGVGAASRLFQRLREEEGLTYDIWSGLALRRPGGLLEIGWACAPTVNHQVWELVLTEIEQLVRNIRQHEVENAREGLVRGLLMDSDLPAARCAMDVAEMMDRGRRFDLPTVRAELDSVTGDEVRSLARSILRPDRMAAALCGPEGVELPG